MKKSLLVFYVMFFSLFFAPAQEKPSLDSVFSLMPQSNVTAGDFILEKESAKLKRPLKSSGTFVFSGEGVIWKTLKPFPSVTAVTKTSLIQVKADGTKNVTDASSNEIFKSIAQTLSSLFGGSRESLESFFTVEGFDSFSDSWKVTLVPKDAAIASALKKIELSGKVNQNASSLDSIKIFQSQTDITAYTLLNQVYRQDLTDEERSFFR